MKQMFYSVDYSSTTNSVTPQVKIQPPSH